MVWYYADGDRQRGPISDEEFQEMVNNGRIRHETLVWTDGMENWESLDKVSAAGRITVPAQPAGAPPAPNPSLPIDSITSPTSSPTPSTPESSGPHADRCSQCGRGPLGLYDAVKLGNLTLCRDCDSDLARHYHQQNRIGAPVGQPATTAPATGAPAPIYLASIPARFFAKMIDQLLASVVMLIIMSFTTDLSAVQQGFEALQTTQNLDQFYSAIRIPMLVGLVFVVLYESLLVGYFGATLGKMVLGIRIVSPDATPARFSQAIIRAIAPAILQLPTIMLSTTSLLANAAGFLITFAYLIAIFDIQKRTLFDHLAGTRVVKNT